MKSIKDGTPETNSHWTQIFDKPKLCVDFHHTITNNCEACPDFSGSYILQDRVKEVLMRLSKQFEIIIYTGNPDGLEFIKSGTYKEGIKDFLKENEIPYSEILFTKPPAMFIVDDRAIHHTGWAETLDKIQKRGDIKV